MNMQDLIDRLVRIEAKVEDVLARTERNEQMNRAQLRFINRIPFDLGKKHEGDES